MIDGKIMRGRTADDRRRVKEWSMRYFLRNQQVVVVLQERRGASVIMRKGERHSQLSLDYLLQESNGTHRPMMDIGESGVHR